MTRICHLFDGTAGWEQRVGVSQLLDRLPPERFESHIAAIHADARASLDPLGRAIDTLPHLARFPAFSGPAVSRYAVKRGIRVIHAWGVEAAVAARMAYGTPLLLQLYDPLIATRQIKRIRVLARPMGFGIACSCELVRRRLIEGGVPQELIVVIRPAVDFAAINRTRRSSLREDLGVSLDDHLVIVPEPVSRAAGTYQAVYAVCMRNHLSGGLRLIVPGNSAERKRIEQSMAKLPVSSPFVPTNSHHPLEELVSISDTMLITPPGDISTTPIAWAMAAGVSIIGTATYAVSEMIANKTNGLLFKDDPGQTTAASISRLLLDRKNQQEVKEAARGQAYEVFGLRRYTEQTMQIYDNLLTGRAPSHDITDAAIDT